MTDSESVSLVRRDPFGPTKSKRKTIVSLTNGLSQSPCLHSRRQCRSKVTLSLWVTFVRSRSLLLPLRRKETESTVRPSFTRHALTMFTLPTDSIFGLVKCGSPSYDIHTFSVLDDKYSHTNTSMEWV